MAFQHLHQYDSALASFDAALARDPRLVVALSNRGILRLQMGDSDGARRDLEAVVAIGTNPDLTADARDRLRSIKARPR